MGESYKRRNFLINPNFQLKISGWFLLLAIINILIFYGCVYSFFDIFYQKGLEIGLPKNHVFFMFIEDQINQMNIIFIISSLITLTFLLISGILISHRIAGPMFRFTRHLTELSGHGNFSKVNFRKGDYFCEVADAFNKVVDQQNTNQSDEEDS